VKTRGPRTKTEHQIKYHEQALSGSNVPNKIETIQVLILMPFNLEKSTLWSTVSNAADTFRRTSITGLP